MRKIKILLYLYQIYKYIIFYPFLGITTTICGSLAVITAVLINARTGSFFGVIWAKLNSYITPMLCSVYGRENVEKNRSYVVISNHQSLYDILVIYGWLPVDFRWVMKIELRKVPVLGYACYKLGHVFIDRSNTEVALASINAAKKNISNGTSIFFFPEGTRSDDGELLPFKKGAFKLAIDMNLPLLPVTITGTKEVVPNGTTLIFPGRSKLVIHEPIDIESYSDSNIDELIAKGREAIRKGLDETI